MEYIRLSEADLKNKVGNRVFVQFLARDVSVRLQKDKVTKFISFNMVDKDTVIEAKLFGAKERDIETIKEGVVYNAAIDIKEYDKAPSGISCLLYNYDLSNEQPESFVDWAEDLDQCQKIIEDILPYIIETYYGKIAYPILAENWAKFARWTAASNQHHTRLGELLVHTSEVVALSDELADYFNEKYGDSFINKPLLLSAAMIHDLEKINELDVNTNSGKTEYSTRSVLSTHIMDILADVDIQAYKLGLGRQITEENEVGEDEDTKTEEQLADEKESIDLLKHCLAAHHGKLEYGSPIVPSIPEAHLLNMADCLSADMYRFNKVMKELDPGKMSSVWASGTYRNTYKDSTK